MVAILHHALLGLSTAALAAAGLRVASLLAPTGLPRALAATPLVVGAAVVEALALGLGGLGGSAAALSAAALVTWLAVRAMTPAPGPSLTRELGTWWGDLSARERALLGALVGVAATWAAWQLRHPQVGFDSEHYHLPEIVLWVQGGHPGAVENVLPGLPVGNYPLTDEVTVAWATGIARSFVPFMLWPWLALALTAAAGWAGLRALRVPPLGRGLAVAALCSSPWLLAWQSHGATTDPAALAWLVCGAALFVLGRERPALVAPALLALGLSAGVKTTTLPLALLVAALGLVAARGRLRAVRTPVLAALVGTLAVGGVWYLRNLFDHGSPFWPILATPWGDPVPHWIELVRSSFLDRPGATIDRIGTSYLDRFGGGLLLLGGGMLAPLVSPRRRTLAAALVTAVALLIWIRSPLTGVPAAHGVEEAVFSTTRYLLPVLAVAALALALASVERRRLAALVHATLLATVIVNVAQILDLSFPTAPALRTPLVGAVAGGALGLLAVRRRSFAFPRVATPLLAAVLGALLALPAHGFVARHGATGSLLTAPVVNRLADDPGYRGGQSPVATTAVFIGTLAGDHLEHRLETIHVAETCARVAARARTQWLVVYAQRSPLDGTPPLEVRRCLPGVRPTLATDEYHVYRPLAASQPAPFVKFRHQRRDTPGAAPASERRSG